jgi:hypothetical protein
MDIECLIIDTEMVPYAMTMDMPIGNPRKEGYWTYGIKRVFWFTLSVKAPYFFIPLKTYS